MVAAETVGFRFEADLFKSVPMILSYGCHGQHWDVSSQENGCCRNRWFHSWSRHLQISSNVPRRVNKTQRHFVLLGQRVGALTFWLFNILAVWFFDLLMILTRWPVECLTLLFLIVWYSELFWPFVMFKPFCAFLLLDVFFFFVSRLFFLCCLTSWHFCCLAFWQFCCFYFLACWPFELLTLCVLLFYL